MNEVEVLVPRLYRLREAAKLTGIGYVKLLEAVKLGRLDHVMVGDQHRVTAAALARFITRLEQGEVTIPSRPA